MSAEPQFRRDPIVGRWSVVAPVRSHRPVTVKPHPPHPHAHPGEPVLCPFCPGQEFLTPDELLAHRPPESGRDGPGWQLRVVPNKFPALRPDLSDLFCDSESTVFLATSGFGRAEVLIECPEHVSDPTGMRTEQVAAVLRAYRDRTLALSEDGSLLYLALFKNVGAEAGASVAHTHSQIIALPLIPDVIGAELRAGETYLARTRRCIFCTLAARELQSGERVIERTEHFLAVTAYAPRYSYEFWVLPLDHAPGYESTTDARAAELAGLLKRLLIALHAVHPEPSYNWFLHTAPLRSPSLPHFHWHIEVLPRTARPAGFEWGYGCFITTVSPEQAAADLRAALPADPEPVG